MRLLGEPASTSAEDLRRVGALARQMVAELGMSDVLGPVAYRTAADGHSEESARLIDLEARRLAEEARARADQALSALGGALDRVAEALLERETLSAGEFEALLKPA